MTLQKSLAFPDPYSRPAEQPAVARVPAVARSVTSSAAASGVSGVVRRLERLVLVAIRDAGPAGLTDREVQAELGMAGDTQRPRRVWLAAHGYVEQTGEKRAGGGSTRLAVCWRYTGKPLEGEA